MRNLIIILVAAALLGGLAWYFVGVSSKPAPTQVEIVACPVTGEKIDPAKAYAQTVYKGKTYYFCCAGCPEEFQKNPEKYVR